MSSDRLRIGQLAGQLGLNPRTIRYYEQVGLLPEPDRTPVGYRLYSKRDEERLRFIRSARRIGLSLGEIRETLAFRERGERPCAYVSEVVEKRLDEVDRQLRELHSFKAELQQLRDRMRRDGPADRDGDYCHHIQSLVD